MWQLFRVVGEDQLMPSWLESRKRPIGYKNLFAAAGNEKTLKLLNSEVEKASEKGRESETLAAEGNLAIVGLDQKNATQNSREEEERADNRGQS